MVDVWLSRNRFGIDRRKDVYVPRKAKISRYKKPLAKYRALLAENLRQADL